MIRHQNFGLAAAYTVASLTLGYLAVSTATATARRIRVLR